MAEHGYHPLGSLGFESHFELQDSSHGRIHSVLLMYPGNEPGISPSTILQYFQGIMEAINGEVIFFVLASFAAKKDKEIFLRGLNELKDQGKNYKHVRPGASGNYHVVHLEADVLDHRDKPLPQSEYAQDAFSVLIGKEGPPALMEPFAYGKAKDKYVCEQIASKLEWVIKPSVFHWEGGNVLSGRNFVFIGKDLLVKNLEQLGVEDVRKSLPYFRNPDLINELKDEEEKKKRLKELSIFERFEIKLKKLLGKKYLYWIGLDEPLQLEKIAIGSHSGWQSLYHIDLTHTLGPFNPDGSQTVYLAQLRKPKYPWVLGEPDSWEDVRRFADSLDQLKEQLDRITEENGGPKFRVKRVHMVLDFQTSPKYGKVYSYNNCQVEISDPIKQVFLPSYFGPTLRNNPSRFKLHPEGQAFQTFSQDFEQVTWVDNRFKEFAKHRAALHCITKVLYRYPV